MKIKRGDIEMPKVLTKREFITKAIRIHENKFDYTKVYYKNNYTKVCIICPSHGEFWQRPGDHLVGKACAVCAGTKLKSTIQFLQGALKTHGNVYDYSKVDYKNNKTKVIIVCKKHGEFMQRPDSHIQQKTGLFQM